MISVQNLGIQFDPHSEFVFRGLNFEIARGESVAIVGPSGGGKSVLLKTLAGLLSPTEGQVTTASQNLGMLFQKNALFDSFTVEENLLFTLRENKKTEDPRAAEKAHALLESVGLSGSESLYPESLSGGMQKRLGIARALIAEPEILLYDEPTAGLDPITSKKIAALIHTLTQERGTTVLIVTNEMQRAYQIADRIYVLAQGQLLGGNTPDALKKHSDPRIRQFIRGNTEGPLTA